MINWLIKYSINISHPFLYKLDCLWLSCTVCLFTYYIASVFKSHVLKFKVRLLFLRGHSVWPKNPPGHTPWDWGPDLPRKGWSQVGMLAHWPYPLLATACQTGPLQISTRIALSVSHCVSPPLLCTQGIRYKNINKHAIWFSQSLTWPTPLHGVKQQLSNNFCLTIWLWLECKAYCSWFIQCWTTVDAVDGI